MIWLALAVVILMISFGAVLFYGAPYLPSLTPQVNAALELSELKAGDMLLELGCGDGKVLIAAAKLGISSVGYELNPVVALVAWLRTRKYKSQVKIICGNFWAADWPQVNAIFTFLLPKYMARLDNKIYQYQYMPTKLISNAFVIPNKPIKAQKNGVNLYIYNK